MAKLNNSVKKVNPAVNKDIYKRLAGFLENKKTVFVILGVGLFLSIINFNARISEAHDDSLYIEAAYRYVHEFPNYYYTNNAPMYPMFLAILTIIFGTNLLVFKVFSMALFMIGAIVYYKALDKKIPEILKYFVLIFLCINHLIVYYSSQTFSESFYMVMQASFFYFFLKYNFGESSFTDNIKLDYKKWLIIGFWMMILTLAKNILVFGVVAIILFYVLKKEYWKALYVGISFAIFKTLYEAIKNLIWGASAIQYKSQMNILLNKDPYDATQGREDISGFIGRFTDNIGLYLGKRFYQILGFTSEESDKASYFLAFLVLALAFYGLYRAIKDKQNTVSFLLFFSGVVAFGTFFVLQARWDQPRFIMVHMPAILLGIFYGIYKFFEKDTINQRVFLLIAFFVICSMAVSTIKRGYKNIPIVSKNLKGDIYYGYTPDWKNYLQISAWCKDSLPETSLVACRKAPMSFIYAKGKHFYPVYSVIAKDTATNQSNPDSALAIFKRNKVTHILLASIRMNPKVNTGDVINTLHFILAPIMQKYPEKLTPIKQIGESESAVIYKINY